MQQTPREQQAEAEVGRTTFARGVPLFLTAFLIAVTFGVLLLERCSDDPGGGAAAGFLHLAPGPAEVADTVAREGLYDGFFTLNDRMLGNIKRLETELEQNSPLRSHLLGPMNRFLTGSLGARNAEVVRGRGGWLFYGPAVQHLTGPGFLTDRAPRHGDPVEVLSAFHAQLAARGIVLVVAPIPVKATICPEQLSPASSGAEPVQNASHDAFLSALEERGVLVCDVTPALLAEKARGPVYLARDSHWTPEGMHAAARHLHEYLKTRVPSLPDGNTAYRAAEARPVEAAGDLAAMLAPDGARDYDTKESVMLAAVEGPDGAPWKAEKDGAVLVLGDSFTNIYSLAGLGWGEHGGLAPWLSLLLQQPVDAITQNGDGAHATRLRLNQAIQRGDDRLDGKKVVVYTFSARELSLGDWKPDLALAAPRQAAGVKEPDAPRPITGTISALTTPPTPGSVPYRDCIVAVRLTGVSGAEGVPESLVVYRWGMRDNAWMPAARQRPGDSVRITIRPWDGVAQAYESYNRLSLEDEDVTRETIWWDAAPATSASNDVPAAVPDQAALVQSLEASDQMVYAGNAGWLFFRPELHFLSLDTIGGGVEMPVTPASANPYPLPAILDFHRQLRGRDINLILVPVPAKASIYADQLGVGGGAPGSPASLQKFYAMLRDAGVEVLDLHESFLAERQAGGPELYCRQDTHWSPRACALAAEQIATRIEAFPWHGGLAHRAYPVEDGQITIAGDLRAMLPEPLPDTETLPASFVRAEAGNPMPVAPDRGSPVVLLGDSHALVFHAGGDMHAHGAGLPDHLAAALGYPVDLVAVRGSGSTAPRVNLARRRDNLDGKRVVVWCFSVREFTESSAGWRLVPVIQ